MYGDMYDYRKWNCLEWHPSIKIGPFASPREKLATEHCSLETLSILLLILFVEFGLQNVIIIIIEGSPGACAGGFRRSLVIIFQLRLQPGSWVQGKSYLGKAHQLMKANG